MGMSMEGVSCMEVKWGTVRLLLKGSTVAFTSIPARFPFMPFTLHRGSIWVYYQRWLRSHQIEIIYILRESSR